VTNIILLLVVGFDFIFRTQLNIMLVFWHYFHPKQVGKNQPITVL